MKSIRLSERLLFEIEGVEVAKSQIESIMPMNLKNKEIFIDFYMRYNGIYFYEGAFVERSKFYKVGTNEYDELEVEYFYNVEEDLENIWEASKENSKEAKEFAEKHMPFARDAAGNDFWVEISTGVIKYISWEDDFPEAITIVAPNLVEFCSAIKPYGNATN